MSARRILIPVVAAAALGAALAMPLRAPAQGRPECAEVLRKMHNARNRTSSRTPDTIRIAKQLGTDANWVEHCAQAYGRRVVRREDPDHPPLEADSELAERREAEEVEELSREEKQTLGDTYVTVIENDEKNRKQLSKVRKEDTVEWEPYETHEWEPNLGHEWKPFLHDDDEDAGFEP